MERFAEVTVGIDIRDDFAQLYLLSTDGETLSNTFIRTEPELFRDRLGGLAYARVVLEVGTNSAWLFELLEDLGHEVILADPRRVKLMKNKHPDVRQSDAEVLARMGQLDLSGKLSLDEEFPEP